MHADAADRSPDEADTVVNHACVMFKEAKQPGADPALFEQARLKFVEALNASGFKAELAYSIALCYYEQKQCGPALSTPRRMCSSGMASCTHLPHPAPRPTLPSGTGPRSSTSPRSSSEACGNTPSCRWARR